MFFWKKEKVKNGSGFLCHERKVVAKSKIDIQSGSFMLFTRTKQEQQSINFVHSWIEMLLLLSEIGPIRPQSILGTKILLENDSRYLSYVHEVVAKCKFSMVVLRHSLEQSRNFQHSWIEMLLLFWKATNEKKNKHTMSCLFLKLDIRCILHVKQRWKYNYDVQQLKLFYFVRLTGSSSMQVSICRPTCRKQHGC
jgi:hypothetical protein